MKFTQVLAMFLILGLAAGCATGVTGIYPAPVRLPQMNDVVVPDGPLNSGEEATFSVSWIYGAEPFTVRWEFSGGTTVSSVSAVEHDRVTEVTVLLDNGGTEPVTYTGVVQVFGARGSTASANFTFVVQPAI